MNSYANSQNWTVELQDLLTPHLTGGFQKLFNQAQRINPEQSCKMFQLCLSRIPELPLSVLEEDYQMLLDHQRVDPQWLRQMLLGIFATFAKVHLIGHGAPNDIKLHKSDLKVPDNMAFIHKCYIAAARELYTKPYLFSPKFDDIERQRNLSEIKYIINDTIRRCLMKQMPLQDLYHKYIKDAPSEYPRETKKEDSESSSQKRRDRYLRSSSRRSSGNKSDEEFDQYLKEDQRTNHQDSNREMYLDLKNTKIEDQSGGKPQKLGEFQQAPFNRDNIRKLQAEIEGQTSGDSTRKNLVLERLMQMRPISIVKEDSETPTSTFDLSLDAHSALSKLTKFLDSDMKKLPTETTDKSSKKSKKSKKSEDIVVDLVIPEKLPAATTEQKGGTIKQFIFRDGSLEPIVTEVNPSVSVNVIPTVPPNSVTQIPNTLPNSVPIASVPVAPVPVAPATPVAPVQAPVVPTTPVAPVQAPVQAPIVPAISVNPVTPVDLVQAQVGGTPKSQPNLDNLIQKEKDVAPEDVVVIPVDESAQKPLLPTNSDLKLASEQSPEEALTDMLMKLPDDKIVELFEPLVPSKTQVGAGIDNKTERMNVIRAMSRMTGIPIPSKLL